MKWKFEFYGWLIGILVLINIILFFAEVELPYQSILVFAAGAYGYSVWKNKKFDFNFVANAILTYIIWSIIVFVVVLLGMLALISAMVPITTQSAIPLG